MIYQTYQAHADMMWPFRAFARGALPVLNDPQWGLTQLSRVRELAAACDVFSLADMTHKRPEFGISTVISGGVEVAVTGRRGADRPRRGELWLPGADGSISLVEPTSGDVSGFGTTPLREVG